MQRNSAAVRLAIQYLPTESVRANPRNPRKTSPRAQRAHRRSVSEIGFNVPVLIDDQNMIVAGEPYWEAARQLGLIEVPCVRLSHLTTEEAQVLSIAHARLAELSTWDDRILAQTLKGLSEQNLDFSLEATGFEMGEIDLRIEGLVGDTEEEDTRADALPAAAGATVTKPGDLWLLRSHRVFCGSAAEAASFDRLMNGDLASMAFTDPPYNVAIEGHVSGLGAIHHREFVQASGEMPAEEFTALLATVCSLLVRHSVDGSIHFVCMDWRHMPDLVAAGLRHYAELKNLCVWVKNNAGMGSLYRSQHELVAVLKAGRGHHRNNIELGRHGRNRTNVWSYPGSNAFGRATEEGHLPALHPTVKPVRLVADAILDVSARGAVVLDPFLGSGTTLIAAERTGRRCYGMDLDAGYVDVAVRRWQAYSGEVAIHRASGRTFDDIAAEVARG